MISNWNAEQFNYFYNIFVVNILELFCCVVFFTVSFKRRKYFLLRLLICFPMYVIYPLTILKLYNRSFISYIFQTFIIYLAIFLYLVVLFQERYEELILCLCAGIATQIIIARSYEGFLLLFERNPYVEYSIFGNVSATNLLWYFLSWVIFFGFRLFLAFILAFIFRRRHASIQNPKLLRFTLLFSIGITLITIPINAISHSLEGNVPSLDVIIRIYACLYAFMVLITRTGILEQNYMQQELQTMKELIHSENKQYNTIRNDIDMINMKCHDIKHQLAQFEGRITDEELQALNEAVQIYDSTLKTGNTVLDAILYKKQLICEKEHIKLSCIADGSCLSFFSNSHLYSLLNNAIENAIEAVSQLKNTEKRIISIVIAKENGLNVIHVTNYFDGESFTKDGTLITKKSDSTHHGFGLKSIQFITEQYNGNVNYKIEDDIFYLNLYYPEQ